MRKYDVTMTFHGIEAISEDHAEAIAIAMLDKAALGRAMPRYMDAYSVDTPELQTPARIRAKAMRKQERTSGDRTI